MGDEIIASGEARYLQEQHGPDPVAILDFHGRPRWHRLWECNPRIYNPRHGGPLPKLSLHHGPRCRPYVDYDRMRAEFARVRPGASWNPKIIKPEFPYRFTNARVRRGELPCVDRMEPGGYVVIEPHHKPKQPNRDWGWERWQIVVDALPLDWLQINPQGARVLRGVVHRPAGDVLSACQLLSGARLYVGPEGGLYHAAAALGIPAVAIFGGFVSPDNQGYADCINLYEPMNGQSPCGQRAPCPHCREALDRIAPDRVIEAVERILARSIPAASAAVAI